MADTGSFGRPSPASGRPWVLADRQISSTAGIRADEGETARWSVRAASVVGVRHRLAGRGSDDAYAVAAREGGGLWLAVADGVGSVPGSAAAAAEAVTAALDHLQHPAALGAEAAVSAVEAADGAVREVGRGACTLVVAGADPDGAVAVARVGDSSAFVLGPEGWTELFAPPGEDAGVPVATRALPDDDLDVELARVQLDAGAVLMLATDGVADPLRDGPTTVAPALALALAQPLAALDLAVVADFSRQGCHDDRTVVAVWPRPASAD